MEPLNILLHEDGLIAVDKPSGQRVHPCPSDPQHYSVMKQLRDQIGQWVYPCHRLDRPTSGVLLFTDSSEMARQMEILFSQRQIIKFYAAIARGWLMAEVTVVRPIVENENVKDAITIIRPRYHVMIPVTLGKYPEARYTIVHCQPLTGRTHQIRRHLVSLRHPIVGDHNYGDRHHNSLWKKMFFQDRLMLHAEFLEFTHPTNHKRIQINSPWPNIFDQLKNNQLDTVQQLDS